jgi:hypothetical protein
MIDKHKKGVFTEFVRSEVYNLLRWTATLSTFIIVASFIILDYKGGLTKIFPQNLFYIMMILLIANIGLAWWRIRRVIYKYFNVLDHLSVLEEYDKASEYEKAKPKLDKINRFARHWEAIIWGLFIAGFVLFIYFLISYLI